MNFLRRGHRSRTEGAYANDRGRTDHAYGNNTGRHDGGYVNNTGRTDGAYGNNTGSGITSEKHHRRTKTKRPLFDINSGSFNRRPSFGQW